MYGASGGTYTQALSAMLPADQCFGLKIAESDMNATLLCGN
jgi:hypothetical protein